MVACGASHVAVTHGIAVHGGIVGGGNVSLCRYFLGAYSMQGLHQRHLFHPYGLDAAQHYLLGFSDSYRLLHSQLLFPPPATAWAEGRQLNVAPFPASATAEGRQFNGAPSLWERVRVRGPGTLCWDTKPLTPSLSQGEREPHQRTYAPTATVCALVPCRQAGITYLPNISMDCSTRSCGMVSVCIIRMT